MPDPGCTDADIAWSGGGDPAIGTGRRFTTRWAAGGVYTVTATCRGATKGFSATVCPIDQWLQGARQFYGPAVDFGPVTVKGSRLVFGSAGTGWTCNVVIRFKRPRTAADLPDESTLIHELGHVWEHQSGQAQLLKGLVEQVSRMYGRDPYDFGGPAGAHAGSRLTQFRKEGQAEIIRDYWLSQHGYPSDMMQVPFSTAGYVDDLKRLLDRAGIGTTAPPKGRSFAAAVDGVVARFVNAVVRLFD